MQGALFSFRVREAGAARAGLPDGLRLAALVGLLVGLGMAGTGLEARLAASGPGEAALNGAGWEARRLAAQMLWLKSHAVLHAGVEERAARPGEEHTRADELRAHDAAYGEKHGHDAGHDHSGEGSAAHVLVIPPRREDFRGLLGDLERAIKPYTAADGEFYSKDADQLLPFHRLVTWADPHFVQGYVIGASFLCRAGRHADEALAFLHEGERYNPRSFEIQTELGRYYLVYKKEYATAERHLAQALAWAPAGHLSETEQETLLDAYRWRALNFVQWRRPERAVAVAREGLRRLGPDVTLQHVVERGGQR